MLSSTALAAVLLSAFVRRASCQDAAGSSSSQLEQSLAPGDTADEQPVTEDDGSDGSLGQKEIIILAVVIGIIVLLAVYGCIRVCAGSAHFRKFTGWVHLDKERRTMVCTQDCQNFQLDDKICEKNAFMEDRTSEKTGVNSV